jgi:hypothetical protein
MVEQRTERVRLETPRLEIRGLMHLAKDGYRSRISDLLNASEREFIILTDATVRQLDGGPGTEHHEFIAVSRRHIVFVVDEEPKSNDPRAT